VYILYIEIKKRITISNALTSDSKILLECAKFERDHRGVMCIQYEAIYKCVVINIFLYIIYPLKNYQHDKSSKRHLDFRPSIDKIIKNNNKRIAIAI
jgi:hypothetical protein